MKRAMFSLTHLEVPELDEALSMGEGLDFIGLVEAKYLGKGHRGHMSTLTTFSYAGIFGKNGEYSVGPFYVYISPDGILKGNFEEDQPDDIYEDIGAARAALSNMRMASKSAGYEDWQGQPMSVYNANGKLASQKQALDAVNQQFNAPTQDPRADKDYVNPFQGKIRSEKNDIDPAVYRDLLDASKDVLTPGANIASKQASVNTEGEPFDGPEMKPYRGQWEKFLEKLKPRLQKVFGGNPTIDMKAGTLTVPITAHPGYVAKVVAEWFGYYDRSYKYDYPQDDHLCMASPVYILLQDAAGSTTFDTLTFAEVHHRYNKLIYLPSPIAWVHEAKDALDGYNFNDGQQPPLPFTASAMKDAYYALAKRMLGSEDKGIEVHTEPKKLPPSQFRKHIDEDVKEEIAESKKDAAAKTAGAYDDAFFVPLKEAPDAASLKSIYTARVREFNDRGGDGDGYGLWPTAVKIEDRMFEDSDAAAEHCLERARKWDYAYAVKAKSSRAVGPVWIVCAWIPE